MSTKQSAAMLTALAAAYLTGCAKQDMDCATPRDQREREQCEAHKAAVERHSPETLPANPKRWGIDGEKK